MFHSLGLERTDWTGRFLSVPVVHMEELFKFYAKKKYDTVLLNEWSAERSWNRTEREKTVLLTFDDGYLDNWAYLFPLLERYGVKATVFVNPEFVDPGDSLRPNLKDCWQGRIRRDELLDRGYLNWPEIRAMQASGLVDIQSHSMSHALYFTGERIAGFYSPERTDLYWLAWLEKPERKPFWMNEDQRGFVPAGTPVFQLGRSLGVRRYFPDPSLVGYCRELFRRNPGLTDEEARRNCLGFIAASGSSGRLETDEEMIERYRYELGTSKEILETNLRKPVDFLCWPGGAYNDLSVFLSFEAGYRASTVSSGERRDGSGPASDERRIVRFAINSSFSVRGREYIDKNRKTLVHRFLELQGQWLRKYPRRMKKAFHMVFR